MTSHLSAFILNDDVEIDVNFNLFYNSLFKKISTYILFHYLTDALTYFHFESFDPYYPLL